MKITSAVFIKGIRGTDPVLYDGVSQVAFVGRSNVGKSSLINSLVNNKKLVKVSNRPGKTTEINFFLINGKFYLVDLPGYGFARVNPKEKEKLKKLIIWFLTASNVPLKKVVLVIDTRVGITEFDRQMLGILREHGHPFIVAANKIDKLSKSELAEQLAGIVEAAEGGEVVQTSAITPLGSRALLEKLDM